MINIYKNPSSQNGVTLILVMMMISMLIFLSAYFLSNALTEELIASSQSSGVQTYYLAEAGIHEMIWKVINDPLYQEEFENNDTWSTTTTRVEPFGPGSGSYTVTATNTSAAHCDIISTGSIDLGNGKTTQRVIKTQIFKATGESAVGDSAGYADGNITITNSYINFLGGSAHSNNTFDVNNQNVRMFADTDLRAVGNYLEHNNASTTILGNIYSANWAVWAPKGVGTAAEITMPAVDFNSADPDSYEQKAIAEQTANPGQECYFANASDFEDYLDDEAPLVTLNCETTYIAGNQDINIDIEIHIKSPASGGVLASINGFEIGKKNGPVDFTFTHGSGKPSGILSGKKLRFLEETGNVDIHGVLYANAEMDILDLDPATSFYVLGGAIGQKLDIDSCYNWLTIEHDNNVLLDTIGGASSSPTLIIEHWEEEY